MTAGRGAWTPDGRRFPWGNGERYYRHKLPIDGLWPALDLNYQAIHLSVKAIQRRVNDFLAAEQQKLIPVTGRYGIQTAKSVAWYQRNHGLVDDGVVGPTTSKSLWRDLVSFVASVRGIPPEHLWGMMYLESAFDPGAVGSVTPDRGLCQINLVAHPAITVEQAFDPLFAIDYSAKRLAAARQQFSGKGPDLQRDCSILQHNSPLAAKTLYEVGSIGADEKGAIYIALVLKHAASY